MVIGLGNDLIEIQRVKEALIKSERLQHRLFTEAEWAEHEAKGSRAEHIAGKFAAKEAVAKSLGTGIRGFKWTDIEILSDSIGKPLCTLKDSAMCLARERGIEKVLVSISHNKTCAMATAIALGKS